MEPNNTFNFAAIPKFCINLKRSTERRALVEKEFYKHNLHVMFIEAEDKRDLILPELSVKRMTEHGNLDNAMGIMACMYSHFKVIRLAKDMNLPAICVFEDDVIFCDDFAERIKYIENLKDLSFDFFSLGGHFSKPEVSPLTPNEKDTDLTKWPHIHKIKNQGGTYGYIITSAVYDFILRNANYNYGADELYSEIYKRFNCLSFVPFLAGCRLIRSDITDVLWEYENIAWFYQQEQITDLNPKPEILKKT